LQNRRTQDSCRDPKPLPYFPIVLATTKNDAADVAASPCGHSISNVSSGRAAAPLIGAVRTCTRAKRERSGSAEPSRHVMVRQACMGASCTPRTASRNDHRPDVAPARREKRAEARRRSTDYHAGLLAPPTHGASTRKMIAVAVGAEH
jgi:hypothetical protein